MCPNCYLNAPAKVQLAKRLEKIWSTLATNRQGMPFCGPLLCGVEPVDGQSEDTRTQLDLFKVLARIRRLEYSESAGFSRDIDEVVANALDLIANRSFPLMEAAKTLKIIRNEQFAIHQQKLDFLDTKIRRLQTDGENGRDDDDNLADADKKMASSMAPGMWAIRRQILRAPGREVTGGVGSACFSSASIRKWG